MSRAAYNKGVCSIHLGAELNARVEEECEALGLSKSKVARFLFKRWLANNALNRVKTGGAPLALSGKWG
jgi:hypothetical protein